MFSSSFFPATILENIGVLNILFRTMVKPKIPKKKQEDVDETGAILTAVDMSIKAMQMIKRQ